MSRDLGIVCASWVPVSDRALFGKNGGKPTAPMLVMEDQLRLGEDLGDLSRLCEIEEIAPVQPDHPGSVAFVWVVCRRNVRDHSSGGAPAAESEHRRRGHAELRIKDDQHMETA